MKLISGSRALSLTKAAVGTGVAFAIGGGAVILAVGTIFSLLGGPAMRAVLATSARGSVLGGILGLTFSGLLALFSRGRSFESLSLPRFTALGAGVGWAAWLLMGVNGAFHAWSVDTAIMNLGLLTLMGGGSAAAILTIARRGRQQEAPPQ